MGHRALTAAPAIAAAALLTALCAPQSSAIVTFGTTGFNGLNINTLVGADRWYNAGYIGRQAIVTNVEAGHIWTGHDTLGAQVAAFITGPTALGDTDRHATWVGQVIAGQLGGLNPGEHQRGIAYGATLWSGAIASEWVSQGAGFFSTGFNFFSATAGSVYNTAMLSGLGGIRTDIVNSSWGFLDTNQFSSTGLIVDSIVKDSGKLMVASAGNGGSGSNTVQTPASAFNVLAVGALTGANSLPPFSFPASFSSRGPIGFFDPNTNTVIPGVRAGIDIAAPGTDITAAHYGGATGGNVFGGTVNTATNLYNLNLAGTSFAAPIVSGGAALIVDASYDAKNGLLDNNRSRDGRTLKAVLLNSADKTPGWNNGQIIDSGGAILTTQALDFTVGAGALNLDTAFDQYLGGTRDVPGDGGGAVEPIGWDFGVVTQGSPVEYIMDRELAAGTEFTVTLSWYADTSGNLIAPILSSFETFDNLDLQVLEVINGVPSALVAQSISRYNNTEHLHFDLPRDGLYAVRVVWTDEVFDLINAPNLEEFAVAWRASPVPAPGALFVAALGFGAASRRRRRG